MPIGMVQELQHVKVLPVRETYIPATSPIVRFCRPAEREALNAILSPSISLPIEQAYRRASTFKSVRSQSSVGQIDALVSSHELSAFQGDSSRGPSDASSQRNSLQSISEALNDNGASEEDGASFAHEQKNVIVCPKRQFVNQYAIKQRRKRFASIAATLARCDTLEGKPSIAVCNETSSRQLATTSEFLQPPDLPPSDTAAGDQIIDLSHDDVSLEDNPSANAIRKACAPDLESESRAANTFGCPQRLRLSTVASSGSFNDNLVEPIVETVGKRVSEAAAGVSFANSAFDTSLTGTPRIKVDQRKDFSPSSKTFNCHIKMPELDRTIYYSDIGESKCHSVLFIPGLVCTRFVSGFLEQAANDFNFRIITIERPGQGRSGPVSSSILWDFPRVVSEVFKSLAISIFSILAHAEGATYALQLAGAIPITSKIFVVLLSPHVAKDCLARFPHESIAQSVERKQKRFENHCMPCLPDKSQKSPEAAKKNDLVVQDKLLWRLSTSPTDLEQDLLLLESVRIDRPLHKLPGKYILVQSKDDADSTIAHNQYLQRWLHDCELFEWHDADRPAGQYFWETQNLWTDVLGLLAASLKS